MTHQITANIGYDLCGRAHRMQESPPWGELAASESGFSIVACLIANTLALSMLSALFAASAELVATTYFSGERMDQGIRLRQVNRYLDSVLAMAQMPREWRQPKAASSAPPQWRAPSAPCSLPESLTEGQNKLHQRKAIKMFLATVILFFGLLIIQGMPVVNLRYC